MRVLVRTASRHYCDGKKKTEENGEKWREEQDEKYNAAREREGRGGEREGRVRESVSPRVLRD